MDTRTHYDTNSAKVGEKVNKEFKVPRKAPTPALADLMAEDEELPFLPSQDQKKFMPLNSLMMYGVTRTYPEILPATTKIRIKKIIKQLKQI